MHGLPEQFRETRAEPAGPALPQDTDAGRLTLPGSRKRIKGNELAGPMTIHEQNTIPLSLVEPDDQSRIPSTPRRILAALSSMEMMLTSFLMVNLTSAIAFVLYRLLNRTKVYGRRNNGFGKNTLVLANHRTMIDSYLIGHLTSWPWGFLIPHMLPFHPAAKENFFRNRIIGWFSRRWKCIPVQRGVRDFNALSNMTEAVKKGQMIIFPEGTRSRTGELLPGRPGTGKLIKDTRCKCIPVYVSGMDKVLPIGKAWPRLFKRVAVNIGKPIPMDDLYALPDGKETSQRIIDRVMEHIAALKEEVESRETNRRPWYQVTGQAVQRVVRVPVSVLRGRKAG